MCIISTFINIYIYHTHIYTHEYVPTCSVWILILPRCVIGRTLYRSCLSPLITSSAATVTRLVRLVPEISRRDVNGRPSTWNKVDATNRFLETIPYVCQRHSRVLEVSIRFQARYKSVRYLNWRWAIPEYRSIWNPQLETDVKNDSNGDRVCLKFRSLRSKSVFLRTYRLSIFFVQPESVTVVMVILQHTGAPVIAHRAETKIL